MAFEGLRDRWEGMAERERNLLIILMVAIVVGAFAWTGITIRSGLTAIEQKNEDTRDALRSLALYRARGTDATSLPEVEIPDEAVKLSRYLETIIKDLGLKSPTYPQEKSKTKGGFTEISFSIRMNGLTIFELKDLLEKIETKNRAVIVRELAIKRVLRDKEKLDVTMTVATFETAKKKDKGKKKEGSDEDEAEDEG